MPTETQLDIILESELEFRTFYKSNSMDTSQQLPEEVRLKIEQEAEVYAEETGDRIFNIKEYFTHPERASGYIAGATTYALQTEELRRENGNLLRKLKHVKACMEQDMDTQEIIDFISKALAGEGGENE